MENNSRRDRSEQRIWAVLALLLLTPGMLLGQIMAQFMHAADATLPQPVAYVQQVEENEPPEFLLTETPQRETEPISDPSSPPTSQMWALLANIPAVNSAPRLTTTNYAEDRAIREALLAKAAQWQVDSATGMLRFTASNTLQVYLGNPEEPEMLANSDIQRLLTMRHEQTVLTARILLGLWQSRRADRRFSIDGNVAVRLDEILAWRGVQKHYRVAYAGAKKRFSDGYQWKQRQQVYQDLQLLQHLYVYGQHAIVSQGRVQRCPVSNPYLQLTLLTESTVSGTRASGCLVSPGSWLMSYEAHGNTFLTTLDRRILQLHPQNDQIALRIALYLSERWRQQTRKHSMSEPIIMADLLAASMVSIDKANLTSRFAPRVEAALLTLYQQRILAERPTSLFPFDRTKAQWGKDWLASYWRLLPVKSGSQE